ncbi:hypothetical protein CapIbe_018622 [Capra ibex]
MNLLRKIVLQRRSAFRATFGSGWPKRQQKAFQIPVLVFQAQTEEDLRSRASKERKIQASKPFLSLGRIRREEV